MTKDIFIGRGGAGPVRLLGRMGNRHRLIAGATGTGKTVTLKLLAEGYSRLGVPVFVADMKGDMASLAIKNSKGAKLMDRLAKIGLDDWVPAANPVVFWVLFQAAGHPLRTTVSEVGPLLLSRMLELNKTQSGVMDILFAAADDEGLLLLDLDDLRAMLNFLTQNRKAIGEAYGLVSPQSIAAIQRSVLSLSRSGGKKLFGEPALELDDLMRQDMGRRGIINVLSAEKLLLKPRLYSTALLWLLSELFERLPEVGDPMVPKLVFFFDEAQLLFDDAPKALVDRIEQVVRLIRSKGVGVYFCTQSPADLPDTVLAHLNNRVQHALRSSTPREQKAVRAAAETFVPNKSMDVRKAIGALGIGEALVSCLDARGRPRPVERTLIAPPRSAFGTLPAQQRAMIRRRSPVDGRYDATVNRESAQERLQQRAAKAGEAAAEAKAKKKRVNGNGRRATARLTATGGRRKVGGPARHVGPRGRASPGDKGSERRWPRALPAASVPASAAASCADCSGR